MDIQLKFSAERGSGTGFVVSYRLLPMCGSDQFFHLINIVCDNRMKMKFLLDNMGLKIKEVLVRALIVKKTI